MSVSSDITCSNTTVTNIVANKMLRLAHVGDDFGESGVRIQNRAGFGGANVYTTRSKTQVVDIALSTDKNTTTKTA